MPVCRAAIIHRMLVAVSLAATCWAVGCGQRVEYRARPGFTTSEDLPDEVVLDDGTIIRYVSLTEFLARKRARERGDTYKPPGAVTTTSETQGSADGSASNQPSFSPWEEFDDGTVRMRARMPEQVVANTMRAVREERYAELWDQMVTQRVRDRAAAELAVATGDGGASSGRASEAARARFSSWCAKNREEVMKLLNRMSFGFSSNSLIMRKTGPHSLSIELTPQLASDFRFRVVEIEFEQSPNVIDPARVTLSGIR